MINCIFDNMPTRHVNYLLDDKRQNQKYCVCIVCCYPFTKKCVFFAIQCNDNVFGVIPAFISFY